MGGKDGAERIGIGGEVAAEDFKGLTGEKGEGSGACFGAVEPDETRPMPEAACGEQRWAIPARRFITNALMNQTGRRYAANFVKY